MRREVADIFHRAFHRPDTQFYQWTAALKTTALQQYLCTGVKLSATHLGGTVMAHSHSTMEINLKENFTMTRHNWPWARTLTILEQIMLRVVIGYLSMGLELSDSRMLLYTQDLGRTPLQRALVDSCILLETVMRSLLPGQLLLKKEVHCKIQLAPLLSATVAVNTVESG